MPQANSADSQAAAPRAKRKVREGLVVSNKMDKTAVVSVERTTRHPLYKKVLKRTKKYMVHDAENQTSIGDKVRIMECRPLSRNKRWRLLEIITKSE